MVFHSPRNNNIVDAETSEVMVNEASGQAKEHSADVKANWLYIAVPA